MTRPLIAALVCLFLVACATTPAPRDDVAPSPAKAKRAFVESSLVLVPELLRLLLALCGYALQFDARGQNANLGAALLQISQAWLVFYTAYRILAPGGVAELHFRWEKPQVEFLQGWIRKLGLVVLALVAVVLAVVSV